MCQRHGPTNAESLGLCPCFFMSQDQSYCLLLFFFPLCLHRTADPSPAWAFYEVFPVSLGSHSETTDRSPSILTLTRRFSQANP